MTYCWYCFGRTQTGERLPMIWQHDANPEDYGYDAEGIVSLLVCPVCGAEAEFRLFDEMEI